MTRGIEPVPHPRPAVADPRLTRPDWVDLQRRDPNRLWLDKNENSDPAMTAVIRSVVAGLPPSAYFSYPEGGPLYHKLARWLGVAPENTLLAAGSDGCIRTVFEAFVSPGDVVIHTEPTFAMYAVYCRMYGATACPIVYRPSAVGPQLPLDMLIDAIRTRRPRVVCLPNPDSPTGAVLDPDALRSVIEEAGRAGAVMLVDEAYYPFHPHTCLPWIDRFPHLVAIRSTGKAWGMAGFRIGYAAAAPELARILHKVRPMYEAGAFSMGVFEGMLDHVDAMEASVARLLAGKDAFLRAMTALDLRTLPCQGSFMHVAFDRHAERVHTALEDLVYYRKNSATPSLEGFSRFSLTPPDRLRPVIERIQAAVRAA